MSKLLDFIFPSRIILIQLEQENKLHAIQLAKMDKAKAKYNQTKQAKDLFEWGETIHESFINRLKGLY